MAQRQEYNVMENGPRATDGRAALRVGLIGAGYIGGVHSSAYLAAPGVLGDDVPAVELVRIADVELARAAELAKRWGWSEATDDWRSVTRDPNLDAVDICVPNFLHAEIAIDALAHGKHVVCEKPLTSGVEGGEEMARAARDSDLAAQVAFYYRTWPVMSWAKEQIERGRIGRVRYFRGRMFQDYASDPAAPLGWRAQSDAAGGGAIGDLGSHVIDLAHYLVGPIAEVVCDLRSDVARVPPADVDDVATIMARFENGASGVLEVSWAMPGHKCDLGFEVVGERGSIKFEWENSNEVRIATVDADSGDCDERLLIGGAGPSADAFVAVGGQGLGYRDGFAIGIGEFLKACAGRPSTGPTFADGLAALRVAAAATESAEHGRWTAVRSQEPK
jgi:predicted dehydrogenase